MAARFAGNAGNSAEMRCKNGKNYAIMPMNPIPTMPMRTIFATSFDTFRGRE
jgi:hypothetical protein